MTATVHHLDRSSSLRILYFVFDVSCILYFLLKKIVSLKYVIRMQSGRLINDGYRSSSGQVFVFAYFVLSISSENDIQVFVVAILCPYFKIKYDFKKPASQGRFLYFTFNV